MFKRELKSLTERVTEARGALIMGLDGIPVDQYSADRSVNLEALSAEYLSMVKKLGETNEELGIGRIQEISLMTEKVVAILMAVNEEYFMILALPPNGHFGRARYELRKSVLRLAKELS